MKTIKLILILAAVFYGGGCATHPKNLSTDKQRPAFSSLPAKYQTLFTTWLNQDCRVDSADLEKDMASAGAVLEDALWEAYNLGPTEEARSDLQNSLGTRYALRLRWLNQNRLEAIDPYVSKQLLAESEEKFHETEMAKLNNRWRDAAVAGLGFVCTEKSIERLRLIAKDDRHTSSIAASEALKTGSYCAARVGGQGGKAQ